jgi:hypothetical protein
MGIIRHAITSGLTVTYLDGSIADHIFLEGLRSTTYHNDDFTLFGTRVGNFSYILDLTLWSSLAP